MSDVADKLSYFQAITGLEDIDLCTDILSAHNWNLELAISTITSNSDQNVPSTSSVYDANSVTTNDSFISGMFNSDQNIPLTSSSAVNAVTTHDSFISGIRNSDENIPSTTSSISAVTDVNGVTTNDSIISGMNNSPGLVWKIVSIPVTVISGSLGLVSRAISLGFWIAGGVLSYSLGMIGMRSSGCGGGMLLVDAVEE